MMAYTSVALFLQCLTFELSPTSGPLLQSQPQRQYVSSFCYYRRCLFRQPIHKWAAALEKAVPAFATVFDGTTNGRGFGVKQFMAMRMATWEETPVGAVNGAPEKKEN
eukprot:INCI13419.3.p6 GENE.INCI13419.3~~INCI13419.3.p6  ORF type:complete len:108 (+),score=14.65 INCI13419.3:2113-2436(+)